MESKKWVLGVDKFPAKKRDYYLTLQSEYTQRRITKDIAMEYRRLGRGKSLNEIVDIRKKMITEYGITEIEATNILNGYHIDEYVRKYEEYSEGIFYNINGPDSHNEWN